MNNLLDKNGCRFKANISGKDCEGMIYVERGKEVYLLQNEKDGKEPDELPDWDFSYSWTVRTGTPEQLRANNVSNFEIIEETSIIAPSNSVDKKKLLLLFL